MDSQITFLSKELKKLRIKPRSILEKKYLIDSKTRKNLKNYKKIIIGLIPFRTKINPIYNEKKELFINQTHILTLNNQLIYFETSKSKCYISKIQKYFKENLNIDLNVSYIKKILDIENSKVLLYTIDISDIEITQILKKPKCDLIDKLENLSLTNKYNFIKCMDFYNNIEVRKSKKELYKNITKIKQNNISMQKCIPLKLSDDINLNFKYSLLYERFY